MTYELLTAANSTIKPTAIKGKNYPMVNERIKAFRMVYPNGAIITEMISDADGKCVFQASIFDDNEKVIGTGHAYEREEASNINKTSYIENCETSAVGRALAMCGFGIDASIASYEEVTEAIANQQISPVTACALRKELKEQGIREDTIRALYNVPGVDKLTERKHLNIVENFKEILARQEEEDRESEASESDPA